MSELYAFMDGADTTLARKVLGEGGDEDGGGAAEGDAAAGGASGRHMCQLRNWLTARTQWRVRPCLPPRCMPPERGRALSCPLT